MTNTTTMITTANQTGTSLRIVCPPLKVVHLG